MAKKYNNTTLSIPERMRAYIHEEGHGGWLERRVLLSVSGGLDSMVMTHILLGVGVDCGVLHCNFQLRGDESEGDAYFVAQKAIQLGIPFYCERINTTEIANEQGISIQMAARSARMAASLEVLQEYQYDYVALAHHLNDHVETGIFNLVKGATYKGLGGIAPSRGVFIRPLLFLTRAEILVYASKHNLSWRDDSSNASIDYNRNFIRHSVMPLLEVLNPNVVHTVANSLNRVRKSGKNLEYFYADFLHKHLTYSSRQQSLPKSAVSAIPHLPGLLQYWLEPFGYDEEQCEQIAESMMGQSGTWLEGVGGSRLLIDRTALILEPTANKTVVKVTLQANDLMHRIGEDKRLFITEYQPIDGPLPDGCSAIVVDTALLKYPLTIRQVEKGDAFQPFGMGGKGKKISDYMVDKKMTRLEKEHCLVLVNGDDNIVWLLHHRADERYRITEKTSKATKFTLV